jgi:hypothetical protein
MGDQHKALVIAGLVGSSGGGGGGTSDYNDLTNKPQINGVPLIGNKSTSDLGIDETWTGTAAEYVAAAATIPIGTPVIITDDTDIDSTPTQGSDNPVTSNGIYTALNGKVDKITGKGLSTEDYTAAEKTKLSGIETGANKTVVDSAFSDSSTNPVQNKVVKSALNGKVDKVAGKQLSTEDYTTSEKNKLSGLTNDYTNHTNKPSINNVTLSGNKTSSNLGLQTEITSSNKLSADLVNDSLSTNKFVSVAEKTSIGNSATKLTGISGSANDYIEFANGKRIYLTDTEPTGSDIPNGSVWLGGET